MVDGGIETTAHLSVTILLIVALIGDFTDDKSMAVFVLVFGAGMRLALAWTLKALYRGKRWARGPLVTWQLFQLAVAIPVLQGSTPLIGVGLLLLAVIGMVGVFTPSALAASAGASGPAGALGPARPPLA